MGSRKLLPIGNAGREISKLSRGYGARITASFVKDYASA
jgi:hypothetical protein